MTFNDFFLLHVISNNNTIKIIIFNLPNLIINYIYQKITFTTKLKFSKSVPKQSFLDICETNPNKNKTFFGLISKHNETKRFSKL